MPQNLHYFTHWMSRGLCACLIGYILSGCHEFQPPTHTMGGRRKNCIANEIQLLKRMKDHKKSSLLCAQRARGLSPRKNSPKSRTSPIRFRNQGWQHIASESVYTFRNKTTNLIFDSIQFQRYNTLDHVEGREQRNNQKLKRGRERTLGRKWFLRK